MKGFLFKLAFIFFISGWLTSCSKKSNPAPTTNPNPPTCTMTVNGTTYTLAASAQYSSSGGQIPFSAAGGGYVIQFVDKAPAIGTITLSDPNTSSYATVIQKSNNETWLTDTVHTGTLTLTTYNTSSRIISGTISFVANETYPAAGGSVINVTNGSFSNVPF
jgi:hypothetical protein